MIDVFPRSGMIKIGKQGENRAVRVILPNIRAGSGSILLLHQRALDKKPYPVPVAESAEGIIWVVSATDTANQGRGQAELQWLGKNGEIVKSVIYQTETSRSLSTPGAVPDEPMKPYVQAVARDAQAAKDAAASAKESARTAEASAGQAGQAAQSAQAAALAAAQNAAAAETAEEAAKQAQTGAEAAKTEAQTAETAAEKAAQEAKTAQAGAIEARTEAEAAQAKAEKAAQGVAADREQIGTNTAGLEAAQQELTATKEQLTETKEVLSTTQDELKKAQRAIQFQAELNKGQTWDFEEDTQEAYQRIVPSGAKAGAVMEWGGKIRKGKNVLQIDVNTSIWPEVSVSGARVAVNNNRDITIYPRTSYTALPAGTYTVSTKGKELIDCAIQTNDDDYSRVITGDKPITFTLIQPTQIRYLFIIEAGVDSQFYIQTVAGATPDYEFEPHTTELLIAKVDEVRVANASGDSTATYPIPAAVKALPGYGWSAGSVANTVERTDNGWQYVQRVGNRAYQDGDKLTDGTTTYYALATPIITDITDLIGGSLAPFAVEAGGSITMHHPKADDGFAVDVPAKIQYITKLSEVSANG